MITDEGELIEDFLLDVSEVIIQRFVKVRQDASPDNPSLRKYWVERADRRRRFSHTGRTTATYVHDLLEA